MYLQKDLTQVKRDIEKYKDCVVTIKSNGGRQKMKKYDGVIKDTYPSVFTVMEGESLKTYSYVDLLTNNVELYLKN